MKRNNYFCTIYIHVINYGSKLHLDRIFRHSLYHRSYKSDCFGRYGDIYGYHELYIRLLQTAFEISLGLTGVLALWLGIMKIGENSGLINALAHFLSPVLCRLFPDIPKGHPVLGSIFMNMSANMLGLDNAATPLGLKAMKELQELNPNKDTASNPMIMFLVINTSGLIIIPISIMVYRAQMGAAQPTDVFIPILLSTFISTLVGVIAVSIAQKINLINKPILILMGVICLFFSGLIYLFLSVSREDMGTYSTLIANILLFSVIILFILTGVRKKSMYTIRL